MRPEVLETFGTVVREASEAWRCPAGCIGCQAIGDGLFGGSQDPAVVLTERTRGAPVLAADVRAFMTRTYGRPWIREQVVLPAGATKLAGMDVVLDETLPPDEVRLVDPVTGGTLAVVRIPGGLTT